MSARSAHLMRERRHGAEPRPAVVATGVRRSVLGTLNNPLASILGYAELVEESLPEGDPRRSDLATIRAETQRARTVVRRLAELGQSTPDGGGRVDPGVVVRDPRGPPRAGGAAYAGPVMDSHADRRSVTLGVPSRRADP